MQVNYNGTSYKSLTEMAKKNAQTHEFTKTFREKGIEIIDKAIDVFFQPDREIADGRGAVNDLMDLESAMKSCMDWKNKKTEENRKNIENINPDAYAIEKEKTETTNNGRTVYSEERLTHGEFYDSNLHNMENVSQFMKSLNAITGLYTCVAMVPGPMSLTVKNMAKEILENSSESSSSSEGVSKGLFSIDKSISGSSASSETSFEKKTADERIIPGLLDLKSRLQEMGLVRGNNIKINATRDKKEYQNIKYKTFPIFGKEVSEERLIETKSSSREIGNAEWEPNHIALPNDGVSTVFGGERAHNVTFGPMTELARKALNSDEALDEFKEKAKETIDKAIDVFFNDKREIKDGKEALNTLTDLEMALRTFDQADNNSWFDRSLLKTIKLLHNTMGTYACVAMVPGPMSLTVKNLPKISIEVTSKESSYSREVSDKFGQLKDNLDNVGKDEFTSIKTSGSSGSSRLSYEISTADEAVIPYFMKIRSDIENLEVSKQEYKDYNTFSIKIAGEENNRRYY